MPYKCFGAIGLEYAKTVAPCPDCGSEHIGTESIAHRFQYGEHKSNVVLTAAVPLHKCQDCGAEYLDSTAEDLMHDAVCQHLGVMTPTEVRSVRQRCGDLSRAEFARITRLGEATVGRWERGELIQNPANDQLLYLLTFPENLIRLRERLAGRSAQRTTSEAISGIKNKFRALNVTADVTERAKCFKLTTAGAA